MSFCLEDHSLTNIANVYSADLLCIYAPEEDKMANNEMRSRRVVDPKPVVRGPLDDFPMSSTGKNPDTVNTYPYA